MKIPCGRDCPRRSMRCHAECPDWAEYEAWKAEDYKERMRRAHESNATFDVLEKRRERYRRKMRKR